MTLGLEGLRAALAYANVLAVLRCIRHSESNNNEDGCAYWLLFGGGRAPSLAHHPQIAVMSPWGWTSAAGAYQAMCVVPGKVQTDTWGDFCRDMGSTVEEMPFDEDTQNLFAVWCLRRRHALSDAIAGRLKTVVDKCSYEWASWPPGRYGQPTTTYAKLEAVYLAYGGTLAADAPAAPLIEDTQPAAPIVDHSPTLPEKTVDPLSAIALFGPLISQLIPQVAKLFDKKTESPAKLEAAQQVINTIVATTATPNAQAALEKISADPVALQAATAAVVTQPDIMQLLEVGGGIERAREQVKEMAALPPQRNVALIVAGFLTPLLYIVVIAVTFDLGGAWSDEMRSVVVTAIVTGLLGSITGFFLGSSYGSSRKTDMLNAKE